MFGLDRGTMCVIQPFKVARHTFLRDVGFFTVAVAFTLTILWDSHIHGWEALAMVGLYAIYVTIVAIGSWWIARRERQREVVRQARSEYASDVGSYHDDRALGLSESDALYSDPLSRSDVLSLRRKYDSA